VGAVYTDRESRQIHPAIAVSNAKESSAMSEPTVPPPPPPAAPPPPPSASNKTLMLVLSYLGLLALVPLLTEKDDAEVQWHAKHGLVILAAEIIVWIGVTALQFLPVVGNLLGCAVLPFLWLLFIVVRVLAMVKGIQGQRLLIPGVSQYADRF
jgi:uncharacterized membrane protein